MADALQKDKSVAGLMWRVPAARVPAPTQEQLEEIMMTKGGRRFNHWKELDGRPYYVGMKRLPTSTKVTIRDCNKHLLKYTYVTDNKGLWTLIESAEMLG